MCGRGISEGRGGGGKEQKICVEGITKDIYMIRCFYHKMEIILFNRVVFADVTLCKFTNRNHYYGGGVKGVDSRFSTKN